MTEGQTMPGARTLGELVAETAARHPDRPVAMFGEQTVTYRKLAAEADAVARGLLAMGVRRGDRVAVLFGNRPEWLYACLGAATAGATAVPLNTWHKEQELAWTLKHAGVAVVLCVDRFLKHDYAEMFGNPVLREAASSVVMWGEITDGVTSWSSFIARGHSFDAALAARRLEIEALDTALLLYTSGSSADPKGVRLLHAGLIENGHRIGERRRITPDDRIWLGAPLFYGLGAANALPVALTHGASLVLHDHFTAELAINAIHASEATVYYGTGNMTQAILDHPSYDPAKVASLDRGLAGISPAYRRLTLLELGVAGATPSYGLTETYGHVTGGWPEDPLETKLTTDGEPLPGVEIDIVDPQTRRSLGPGEEGAVLLRCWVTPGYHENPEETSNALLPDGRFETGDLGVVDAAGRFVFRARVKDVIKSGGMNVSPAELEQLIATHPSVRDVHVVGIGDHLNGEAIVAFVDARRAVQSEEIQEFVKDRAASFKVPHYVLFCRTEDIPRLASGKVARRELVREAERYLAGEIGGHG